MSSLYVRRSKWQSTPILRSNSAEEYQFNAAGDKLITHEEEPDSDVFLPNSFGCDKE